MLEQMRQKGASIFIYLIFGVLIAVFVINFGPQGGQGACGTGTRHVLEVDGSQVTDPSWLVAYSNPYNPGRSRDRTYFALDTLIRRELLADAALERGLRPTPEMVEEEIKKGVFHIGGLRIPLGEQMFDVHEDGSRTWNVLKYKTWIRRLDVRSTNSYKHEQERAMQATLMYELLAGGVRVSREEALNEFLYTENTVTYDTVTFAPSSYRAAIRLTDADRQRFLTTHEAEVKARYQAEERNYKGRKPELKLRQIFVATQPPAAAPTPPSDDTKPDDAAGSAAGSAAAAAAKPPAPEKAGATTKLTAAQAKAKLEAARASIAAGKLKFADAVKQLSTDEAQQANGGDMGWRTAENAQLGDLAVNEAVKALGPGEMTPVITTDAGAFLVIAEDKREGDLTYDQVKAELADELARDLWSKEAAKRAALAAFAEASEGTGKNLEELFEREATPAPNMNMDFLNDPNLTPEQKRMIIEQLQQQTGTKQGSITWESKDIPAAWKSGDGAGGSGSAAGTQAGSAAGTAAPIKLRQGMKLHGFKAQADGSTTGAGAGSAAPTAEGSAAGSAAGAAPATPPPPVDAPVTVEASKDVLPAFGDVAKPKVVRQGPHPRLPQLPGVPKELTPVLFDELSEGNLAKRVYESSGSYVLVQLSNKVEPKVEDFEKDADKYMSRLQLVRGYSFVEDWIVKRCEELTEANKIQMSPDKVAETDDKGKPLPQVYRPCMYGTQWLNAMLPHTRPR